MFQLSRLRLGQALRAADKLGVEGYVSVQPRYNILYREIETELLPLVNDEGLGVLVYNPLAGGFLSGKYKKGQDPEEGTRFTLGTAAERYQARYWHEAQFEAVERLKTMVDARGLNMVSVAVGWVLAQKGSPRQSSARAGPTSWALISPRSMSPSTMNSRPPAKKRGGLCPGVRLPRVIAREPLKAGSQGRSGSPSTRLAMMLR
ncbi:MAG: aldo/keto reductase [Gammaproteobacteria bacterium]|nr:aldo/keto reductase [Gammaproteobacteria bacterium]